MSMNPVTTDERGLEQLEYELSAIRSEMIAAERQLLRLWRGLPAAGHDSARNLLHYLAMRRRDLLALRSGRQLGIVLKIAEGL